MSTGTILHVNAVGLAAAIEMHVDHSLRTWPFVVANERAPRAVVLAPSPVAHREGVRPGMVLSLARTICPELKTCEPRPMLYRSVEESLRTLGLSFTPLVERAGAGHLYLDLAGTSRLNGVPEDAAQKLRACIYEATGLTPTVALASNKTVCKVATRVFRPSGFVALSYNEENRLIRQQPVELLPGVGPVLLGRLSLLGLDEIGQLADLDAIEARALGPRGSELVTRARGIDTSPVDPEPEEKKSVHGEVIFEPDTSNPETLRLRLGILVRELAFSLRKQGFGAHKVTVSLTYTDGPSSSATEKAVRLRTRDDELISLACAALGRATTRRVRIRRLGITLSGIEAAGPELDLFEPQELRMNRLQIALDTVRTRFGPNALIPCAALCLSSGVSP